MPLVFDPLPDWSDPAVSVLAAVPDGDSDSNRVYVIAVDTRRERRPYVVFTTWWDGQGWQASNGHYDLPMSKALAVLTERLR
jgi:hypothetical protein